ncbi:antitoxin (DNA-binding transcriptional repressor) of toxin-antitoxin stability system [Paraburkholderia sp. GAS448]
MVMKVSKAIFKAKACELFRHVEMLGEPVVVTDRGQPTIEIRPYRSKRQNPLDLLRASIVHFNVKHATEAVAGEQEE